MKINITLLLIFISQVYYNSPIPVVAPSLKGINPAFINPANVARRGSNAPYISGDLFRFDVADFKYDELKTSFNTNDVKQGDIIFVISELLPSFFNSVHPQIKNPYILLTHNSTITVPGRFAHYLNDEKIIAWFGHNIGMSHPKLHPLPLGLANRYWPHGNTQRLENIMNEEHPKTNIAYCNFARGTNPRDRNRAAEYFKKQPFTHHASRKPWVNYLRDLKKSQFIISPPGKGIDCHRTYEALYMGSYPIVLSSYLDPIFEELPVVIVKSWQEVTSELLDKKFAEFTNKKFSIEKLYAPYWIDQIKQIQSLYK